MPQGTELYDAFPGVRQTCGEVAGVPGVVVERMLTDELRERRTVGLVREAVLAPAVHDHLVATGVRPGAIGGLSLGGAVDRAAFLEVLVRTRNPRKAWRSRPCPGRGTSTS